MTLNGTALIRSTIGVLWLVVAMTLLAEQSPQFKALLVQFAGHHWVGKGIIAALAYVVFYLLFRRAGESNVLRGALLVVGSVILGGLLIFLYFAWHFIKG